MSACALCSPFSRCVWPFRRRLKPRHRRNPRHRRPTAQAAARETAAGETAPAAASSRPPDPAASSRGLVLTVQVTNTFGQALDSVRVTAAGPVARDGVTDQAGLVRFAGMRPGEYRLRLEKEGLVTLEKDVTLAAGKSIAVDATMNEAPKPPPPPPAPAPTAAPIRAAGRAAGDVGVRFPREEHHRPRADEAVAGRLLGHPAVGAAAGARSAGGARPTISSIRRCMWSPGRDDQAGRDARIRSARQASPSFREARPISLTRGAATRRSSSCFRAPTSRAAPAERLPASNGPAGLDDRLRRLRRNRRLDGATRTPDAGIHTGSRSPCAFSQ